METFNCFCMGLCFQVEAETKDEAKERAVEIMMDHIVDNLHVEKGETK